MDYYDIYLKHKYPFFDCRTEDCKEYVVIKEAMCNACFYRKYPEIKVDNGEL